MSAVCRPPRDLRADVSFREWASPEPWGAYFEDLAVTAEELEAEAERWYDWLCWEAAADLDNQEWEIW